MRKKRIYICKIIVEKNLQDKQKWMNAFQYNLQVKHDLSI